MASMLPPFPGSETEAPQQFSPSSLLGGQPQPPQGNSDALRAVMQQLRDIEGTIQALVGQFPEAAADGRMAVQSLHRMLVKVVSTQQAQEPANPQLVG